MTFSDAVWGDSMTKYCRDKQIERVDKLLNAIRIFEDWHQDGDVENAIELLTQLQQTVILIGTVIEQELQDYNTLVTEAEQLCEVLYQIGVSLLDDRSVVTLKDDAEKLLEDLRKELGTITVRREVVFFPYQVSMWDSLESVWAVARDDEQTDVYVVPIPFYDVLPDKSLGCLHDQSTDYPVDVPITACEDYFLEERHPDVIFFHNPYDGCNTVTRVPERYYSSHLRKCTEQLVYIPYFVSKEGGPANHQCYTPGVLFADKVIVQPGKVYEKYCQVYMQAREANGWECVTKPAKEKFLPLSSPKFDKVLNTRCDLEDLPESWKQVIFKTDGSRKKIVFYNLTIKALLYHNEKMLEKIERIFQIFEEYQDEVVLLWRPHPLLLTTINSMRAQFREAYLERVQQFKAGEWGIFDETPDASLAMVLSDVYYGDGSSLVVTYQALGKPLYIQDVAFAEENDIIQELIKDQSVNQGNENVAIGDVGSRNQIGRTIYREIMSAMEG